MRLIAGLLLMGLSGCSGREQPPTSAPAVPSQAPTSAAAPPQLQAPAAELVMDVMQVVGKSEADVSALLGQPASCEDIHRARLCKYSPNDHEVMFVAGAADMITVRGMRAVPFNHDALHALGLEPGKPDHSDEHAIGWTSIPGLEEVTIFPGQKNYVDYAYVKVGKH